MPTTDAGQGYPEENVDALLAEMDAQGAAERAVDGMGSTEEAMVCIRGALDIAGQPRSLLAEINQAAMRLILRQPLPALSFSVSDLETEPLTRICESIALFWYSSIQKQGVCADSHKGAENLQQLCRQSSTGAVERMALSLWLDAITSPIPERRLWRRALRISSSFGTESHPVILWTYLATFLCLPVGSNEDSHVLVSP